MSAQKRRPKAVEWEGYAIQTKDGSYLPHHRGGAAATYPTICAAREFTWQGEQIVRVRVRIAPIRPRASRKKRGKK